MEHCACCMTSFVAIRMQKHCASTGLKVCPTHAHAALYGPAVVGMLSRMIRADAMQAHPSRHGTYDGISMNPYETVFIKASWHVGEPFAAKYAAWQTAILKGGNGAEGEFDEPMYRFAIECAPLPHP